MNPIETYPAQQHPGKALYNSVENVITNDGLTVQQKQNRLKNLGFTYAGTAPLTDAVFTQADNILNNTHLSDQQKINRLQHLGFTRTATADQTLLPATTATTTAATTSALPLWVWVAGGFGLLMLLKK